ncbi:MAG: hypothetical protein ACRC33_09420 [Gemmataceae bacterium]
MAFNDTWAALQQHLRVGTLIPNWTAHSETTGEPFEVVGVNPNFISVTIADEVTRSVSPDDFRIVYSEWAGYIALDVPRKRFGDSFQTKYVISILHWLQGRLGGSLP